MDKPFGHRCASNNDRHLCDGDRRASSGEFLTGQLAVEALLGVPDDGQDVLDAQFADGVDDVLQAVM